MFAELSGGGDGLTLLQESLPGWVQRALLGFLPWALPLTLLGGDSQYCSQVLELADLSVTAEHGSLLASVGAIHVQCVCSGAGHFLERV